MNEIVALLIFMPYSYLAPWLIIRRDMRKLPAAKLARCWNGPSFAVAVVGFSPFCILVHFVKGHGWLKGAPLGLFWAAIWVAGAFVLNWGLDALGLPPG